MNHAIDESVLADSSKVETRLAELIGKPDATELEFLERCVGDAQTNIRFLSTTALGQLGIEGLSSLVKVLEQDAVPKIRIAAANGIAQMGAKAQAAVKPLSTSLENGCSKLRWHSAFALSRIGEPAVASLTSLTGNKDAEVQMLSIQALGWIGPEAESSLTQLEKLSESANRVLRMEAIAARVKICDDQTDPQIDELIEMTKDDESQLAATVCLGELGEKGSRAREALLRCLQNDDAAIGSAASIALARIKADDDETIDELRKRMDVADPDRCASIMAALASLGAAACEAIPRLKEIQNGDIPNLAAGARVSIEMIQKACEEDA